MPNFDDSTPPDLPLSATKQEGFAKPCGEQRGGSDWREKYRVRISLIFGLIFICLAQPRSWVLLVMGLLISASGVLLRQWSAGCIKKMDELAVQGPYALIRHPLYTGSFLLAVGFLVSSTSFWPLAALERTLLFWSLLWILMDSFYLPKIRKEEKELKEKFGENYSQYCQKVARFLPKALRLSQSDRRSFDFGLWLKNKEYGSLIVFFIGCVILIARYRYHR